jgi:hypothetical protein
MDHTAGRTEERSRGGRWPFGVLAGLALGTVAACSDSTGPKDDQVVQTDLMCSSAQVPLCTEGAARGIAQDATSDARSRSLPALENAAGRSALDATLADLSSALSAGNVTKTRAALSRSRTALDAARAQLSSFGGDAADLGAVELLLDHVAAKVGS